MKKFPEFNYGDGSHIPKRSRRSIWRAAVENCKNISQLALQVCLQSSMFFQMIVFLSVPLKFN